MDEKRRQLEADLQRWRAEGNQAAEGSTLGNLAWLDLVAGDRAAARRRYEQGLALLHTAGDQGNEAAILNELANLEWQEGHAAEARRLYEQAGVLAEATGHRPTQAAVLHGLAMLDMQAGEETRAREGFTASLALRQELGDRANAAATQMMLGQLLFKIPRWVEGYHMVQDAVATFDELQMRREHAHAQAILRQLDDALPHVKQLHYSRLNEIVTPRKLDEHERWARGDRSTPNLLIYEDTNFYAMPRQGSFFGVGRFVRCDFTRVDLSYSDFAEAELTDCTLDDAIMTSCTFRGARFTNCTFRHGDIRLAKAEGLIIAGGDWADIWCNRGLFKGMQARGVGFRTANFANTTLDEAVFVDCDFRDADFSNADPSMEHLCRTVNTRFEHCDLRGANFAGRALSGTVFDHCRVHGLTGPPRLDGPCTVIAPDFSEAGDGSDVRDGAALLAQWGQAAPP
jgi:uncharacterized protein YjbI with pentapeptide repeats